LDLPVYLRLQRTDGLTGGVAATQWNYGRHLLAAFSGKIILHLPGPATACSATIGSKLPLAAFESQRILGRGPERPLSLGCPFLFAGAANGGSPPFTSIMPHLRTVFCAGAAHGRQLAWRVVSMDKNPWSKTGGQIRSFLSQSPGPRDFKGLTWTKPPDKTNHVLGGFCP
jgi:hypothetical protein